MDDSDARAEAIEISLLLEGIFQRYGYDFRDYGRQSVSGRLAEFVAASESEDFSRVTSRVLRDPAFFRRLLPYFSISVTSLFRNPVFYRVFGEEVVPLLRTWPHFKVWHAGCATGEEVYSVAILLREAGILERAMIYATDISQPALDTAKAGVYPLAVIRHGTKRFHEAGGFGPLSAHYHARYEAAIMEAALRARVTFARHNLATDRSFGKMQAIVCRNVLIYFNEALTNHVLELFYESLERGGFLCLGSNESLKFTTVNDRFDVVDARARIFKKRVR